MTLTLADFLELPVVQAGRPTVVVGSDRLDAEISWVHVTELLDVDAVLSGGELVLTTGLFLAAAPPAELDGFIRRLAAAGARCLALELGRAFRTTPQALVRAAARESLPLITLDRTVRFVEITQAVHTRIINEQHATLRFSHQVHESFNALSLEGARAQALLDRTAEIGGTPVVLEDLAHRVTAHALAGQPATAVLSRWAERSRSEPTDWVTAPVGPVGRRSGRLVLPTTNTLAGDSARILVDRAAQALTLSELLEIERVTAGQQHQTQLLADLLADRSATSWRVRAEAAGLALEGLLIPLALASTTPPAGTDAVRTTHDITSAAATLALPVLASPVDAGTIAVVINAGTSNPEAVTPAFLEALRQEVKAAAGPLVINGLTWAVAAGPVAADLGAVAEGLREAVTLARVASELGPDRHQLLHRAPQLRARMLVHQLESDPRLLAFAEATLQPLAAADRRADGRLTELLLEFLEAGGNKSVLARRSHLSRPTLYHKLSRISDLLEVDLDDGETRLALHLALLVRSPRS